MNKISFLIFWIISFFSVPTLAQDTAADSVAIKLQNWQTEALERNLQTAKKDTTKVILLNELIWRSAFNQPEKGLSYFRQSLALSQNLKYKRGIAYAYSNAAWCHTTLGNYHFSLQLALKSLPLFEELNEKERIAWVYLELADIYREFGDLEKALQMAHQSIKGYNELQISARVPIAVAGSIYELQNRQDSALIYVQKAQALDNRDNGGKWGWIKILLGNIYKGRKEYDLALNYYRAALPITIAVNVKKDIVTTYNGIAQVHKEMGQLDSCIYYANQVLQKYSSISYQKGVFEACNILSESYKVKNEKDSTIKYLELSAALNKKLFNLEKQRDIQNLAFSEQMRLEAVEKERQRFRSQLKLYAFLTIVLLLLGIGLLLWRHKQQRKKAEEVLQKQKQEIKQEQLKANLKIKQIESDKLRELDMMKSRFFSNITHEFRTPLSLILPPAEQMLQEVEEPKHRQRLTLIKRNARQLLGLINQLLDISKLESGNMPSAEFRGDVAVFISQLLDAFRPAAEEKGIRLLYKFQGTAGEWLFDADKWSKIINNLLSNALKFTPSGGEIEVKLDIIKSPQSADSTLESGFKALLIIQDTGIGIPAQKLSHIFDRFYQVDNSHTRAFGGTGIGLSLVKELIELLNGQIKVNSEPGAGTTFTMELPIRQAESCSDVPKAETVAVVTPFSDLNELEANSLKENHSPMISTEAPLLLLIDDNADLREFIAGELSSTYRVLTATNGEDGWQLAQQELPEVIISDVMMPLLDGYALTERLKTNALTNHIAIMLLTAKAAQESKVAGLEHGADDYLTKPFHLQELKLRLHNLLDHQQKLRQHYQQQLTAPQQGLPTETIENKFLQILYQAIEAQLDNSRFDVDSLAQAAAMSRRTLYRKLATLTGLKPNEVIQNYRLLRATQLLKAGQAVSQVAYQVGFESPSYFGQCFKEKYQITPSEYLQQHLAQF